MLLEQPYLLCFLFSMVLNLSLYGIAFYFQTDKLTDLTFAITICSINIIGFLYFFDDLIDVIVLLLVTIWSIRLASYLFRRIHKMGRDKRFDAMRSSAFRFLGFWVLQGISCFFMSIPFVGIYLKGSVEVNFVTYMGIIIAILGFILETIADSQKYRFKSNFPDDFMQSGLWKYVRHPNYTGELLFWWGIALIALSATGIWWHSLGAIWITILIVFVSGIPLLDAAWQNRYGHLESFRKYRDSSYRLIPFLY